MFFFNVNFIYLHLMEVNLNLLYLLKNLNILVKDLKINHLLILFLQIILIMIFFHKIYQIDQNLIFLEQKEVL